LKCPPWNATQYVVCLYSDCLIRWTVTGDMSNPFSIYIEGMGQSQNTAVL